MKKQTVMSMVLCVLVASCGGGDTQVLAQDEQARVQFGLDSDSRAPSAMGQRRHALASSASYDPALAAQLFSLAETSYAKYFPSTQSTRAFEYWAYRYYPETSTYLAVIGSGVYVLGGEFGPEALYVGEVPALLGQTPVGSSQRVTAAQLSRCPYSSSSSSPSFYKCMVGYFEGTQTFDTSNACRLEISEQGVFTLSSAGQTIVVGPNYSFVYYANLTAQSILSASVKSAGVGGVNDIELTSAHGFSLSNGGTIQVEGTPPGATGATISCRLSVPK